MDCRFLLTQPIFFLYLHSGPNPLFETGGCSAQPLARNREISTARHREISSRDINRHASWRHESFVHFRSSIDKSSSSTWRFPAWSQTQIKPIYSTKRIINSIICAIPAPGRSSQRLSAVEAAVSWQWTAASAAKAKNPVLPRPCWTARISAAAPPTSADPAAPISRQRWSPPRHPAAA